VSDSNLNVNDLPNILDKSIEKAPDLADAFPEWPLGVAHGYTEGRIAVVLHISLCRFEREEKNFCATFYRSIEGMERWLSAQGGDEAKLPADDTLHGDIEQSVLVSIVEFPDDRKEGRQFMVPSVVRLRSLDACLRITADHRQPARLLSSKPVRSIGDGELQILCTGRRIGPTVANGDSIDDVIQCAPKTVNAIASDQGPAIKGRRLLDGNDEAVAATISVAFFGENIRFSCDPRLEFGLKSIEMFLSTTHLQETTGELRTDHAIYGTKPLTGVSS
jgi:hypothetical protein